MVLVSDDAIFKNLHVYTTHLCSLSMYYYKTIDFRAKKWPKHLGRVKSELTRKIKKSKNQISLGFCLKNVIFLKSLPLEGTLSQPPTPNRSASRVKFLHLS